jgi:hypothetical protein
VHKKDELYEFTIYAFREMYTIKPEGSCPDDWGWFPSRSRGFYLCHNIESSTDTQTLSNPKGGKDFARNKAVDF